MKSMTAYAYRESSVGKTTVSAEIKGYNGRFLDLSIRLPSWLSSIETWIREYINSRFSRGNVEVLIRIKEENIPVSVSVNENAVFAYKTAIEKLSIILDKKIDPDLSLILGFEGVLETESSRDPEKYRALIEPVLAAASDQFEAERIREGEHTLKDILGHIALLEEAVEIIKSHVPELEESIKKNLRERFMDLLGERIDETRILAETAVLLVKYTISEELSRLSSHLSEFKLEAAGNPCPGKKLDFLSQEIGREINTIGSKTPVLEVSRTVVDMKNALENIREQLRNVE